MPKHEHHNAALTNNQVSRIRELYLTGRYSFADLSVTFKVSRQTIGGVLTGRYWRHGLTEQEREALEQMRQARQTCNNNYAKGLRR